MKKKIRFLKAFDSHQAGQEAEVDAQRADSLINLGLAEEVRQAPQPERQAEPAGAVAMTDEQLQRIAREIRETAQPTEDDIRRILDEIAPERAPAQRPAVNANTDVEVRGDRVAHWRRRATRYFNALAIGKKDQARSVELVFELQREIARMPADQHRDEDRETERIISEADLSRSQKARLREFLEVGEFTRLHTTSTSDTPKSGYLLPKPFLAEVFVIVEQYGVVRRLFRSVPMTSKTLDLKNVSSKPTAYWVDEGSNITASDLVFAEGQMALKKLAAITSWTTELEEDQALALLPIAIDLFAESFAQKEDQAGLIGDGTSTYGSFTGLLNLAGATVITLAATNTAGSDLAETNTRAAKSALSLARRNGARWIMHRSFHEHIAQFENAAGFRVFQENITGNAPDTLHGFPIEYSEVMPDIDSVGANEKFMILGAPNRALMGQGRGLEADISREAVLQAGDGTISYNAFQADGALLRLTERISFAVPTAVQSAFVVLRTAAS